MDYFNTTYNEETDLGAGFHDLINNLKPLTFRVEMFQLLLSMKSQLNVNSAYASKFLIIFLLANMKDC